MAMHPEDSDTKSVPKPGPASVVAPRLDLLLALLACDWIVGDKTHYTMVRAATIRRLTSLADPEAKAALARLEGMST